jgi:hypothetical protein
MLFPEGLKCKNALPEEVQVSSRGVNYTDFFAFQRGKNPQKQRSLTGGVWFLNVTALFGTKARASSSAKLLLR